MRTAGTGGPCEIARRSQPLQLHLLSALQLKAKLQDAYTSAAKDAAERLASCVFHSAPNSIEAALQSLPPPPEGQPSKARAA